MRTWIWSVTTKGSRHPISVVALGSTLVLLVEGKAHGGLRSAAKQTSGAGTRCPLWPSVCSHSDWARTHVDSVLSLTAGEGPPPEERVPRHAPLPANAHKLCLWAEHDWSRGLFGFGHEVVVRLAARPERGWPLRGEVGRQRGAPRAGGAKRLVGSRLRAWRRALTVQPC